MQFLFIIDKFVAELNSNKNLKVVLFLTFKIVYLTIFPKIV